MESLVTRLENEVGLTNEQAKRAVGCIRSYMTENDLEPDWEEFLESKAKKLSDSAKKSWAELSGKSETWGDKVDDWTDKAQDALGGLTDKAKQTLKDARNKAADFLADKD